MTESYDTNIVPIGRKAPAGRGNAKTTPSAAARSLAAASPKKKPVKKAAHTETADVVPPVKKAASKKPTAKKPAPKKSAPKKPKPNTDNVRPITSSRSKQKPNDSVDLDDVLTAMVERAEDIVGDDWEARLSEVVSMIRHRLAGDFEVDEFGLDKEFVSMAANAAGPLIEKWFRLQVRGIENIPREGGALLVGNHSGTVPLDGFVTGYAIHQYANRNLRPLAADLVFKLPFVGQLARAMGATLACNEDAERLLGNGELAAVWPEGFKGVGKPYSQRYKLQRFGRGGFVASAVRAQVPIVPVSIVGAEEIYPLIGNIPSLARLLGLPYLPVTPFFPWLGPLGMIPLPSKWIIEFGEPIRTDAYEPAEADDPMLLFELTDQVREAIQQTLYKLLIERGNPFI